MDTNLPNLDIVEDIEEIMNDEPTPQSIADTIEEVEKVEEDTSPFVQTQPKKKELSEKQKAHLEKIRKLAFEKKAEKTKAKKEALMKVEAEHKPRSYKPRKKKVTEEEKEQAKKYEERTLKMEIKEPREQEANKTSTPEDFNPTHKEQLEAKKKKQEETEKLSFLNFMGNMEKYFILKDDYDRETNSKRNTKTSTKTHITRPQQHKAEPKQQHNVEPQPNIIQVTQSPFDNYFG